MKKQSTLISLLALSVSLCAGEVISTNLINGEIVNINGNFQRKGITNSLNLPSGKQIIIHGINVFPYNDTRASVAFFRRVISPNNYMDISVVTSGSSQATKWSGPVIGPANLEYGLLQTGTWGGSADTLMQTTCSFLFEIKDDPFQVASVSSQNISSASVVVPANATGDVDVLLEQSTDMITWTQCLPGTYNSSTQKRFFRVRAVEK
jgi:hypothetical protein